MIPRRAVLEARGRKSQVFSVPAPIGGWNARDGLDAMEPTDALVMENFFPDFGAVRLRRGFASFAHSMPAAAVQTLMTYETGVDNQLLAACSGNIYNITAGGTISSDVGSGFSNNRWSWVNFNGILGMVNGTDTPQQWNGSALSTLTLTGTGLTATNVIGVASYRSRTYFWEEDSQDFWYSAVDTLGGTLVKFPLSRVGQFGGTIAAISNYAPGGQAEGWGGSGTEGGQRLVIVLTSGEIVTYVGSDPGDANDFAFDRIYRVGSPLGSRCLVKLAGDLILMTVDGFVPMSAIVQQGRFSKNVSITDRIRGAIVAATGSYSGNEGWDAVYYPKGNRVLFNVPVASSMAEQYVVNAQNGAWCKFTGMNAYCWAVWNDNLYFGGVGEVFRADTGFTDDGESIRGIVRTAYSAFGQRGVLKHIKAVRPTVASTGSIPLQIVVQSDFGQQNTTGATTTLGQGGVTESWEDIDTLWELWDEDWGEGTADAYAAWLLRSAKGYRFNLRLEISTSSGFDWFTTEFLAEMGSGI